MAVATIALGIGALTGCSSGSGTATAAPADATTSPAAASVHSFAPPVRAETGVDVTDRDHGYHLVISPDWVERTDIATGDMLNAAWAVAPAADGVTPSVSIATETVPDMSLSDYLDLSIQNLPRFFSSAQVGATGKVKGLDGSTVATIDYAGDGLRFVAVIAMGDGHAVIATLVAPPAVFEATRAQVMPYLITVTATA